MTGIMRSASIALLAAAIGCMGGGRGQTARAPATAPEPVEPPEQVPAPGQTEGAMAGCPTAVPGTEVAVADVPAGASMTFRTAEPNVEELRSRVHAMAQMHEHHGGTAMGGMHGGMHPGDVPGGMHGGMGPGAGASGGTGSAGAPEHGAMMPPSARALSEEVEGGARIVVTAEDPADVERLRAAVRTHAAHMREARTCTLEMEHPANR